MKKVSVIIDRTCSSLGGCTLKSMVVQVECKHFYFFKLQVALLNAECARTFALIAATLTEKCAKLVPLACQWGSTLKGTSLYIIFL